jgi:hypothetical protein
MGGKFCAHNHQSAPERSDRLGSRDRENIMAMKPCRECGAEVADTADSCPHCGVKAPAGAPSASTRIGGSKGVGCLFVIGVIIAFFVYIASNVEPPDPHITDLLKQAADSSPLASRATIQMHEVRIKNEYLFDIVYPTRGGLNNESDATDLIKGMLRKLLADGQNPSKQKISISVYIAIKEPDTFGESGQRLEHYPRTIGAAHYEPDGDFIRHELCVEVPQLKCWPG